MANDNSERDPSEITRLLQSSGDGSEDTIRRLLPLVYEELLRIARSRMLGERAGHTLQATALVSEAFLRLVGPGGAQIEWNNRAHFFHAAAEAMRRILIEHARSRGRIKRGRGRGRLALDEIDTAMTPGDCEDEIVALDAAICRLEAQDARAGLIVRLRYFAGLSVEDTAAALSLSPRTVKREWQFARAWLFEQLRGESPPHDRAVDDRD